MNITLYKFVNIRKRRKTHCCWIKDFARLITPRTNSKLEYRFGCLTGSSTGNKKKPLIIL